MTDIEKIIKMLFPEIMKLIDTQKNSELEQKELDKNGNTNCNMTLPHLECKNSMREVERREYKNIFSSSRTKQNVFTTKPEGQSSESHINANFAHSICHDIDVCKISRFSGNSEELCDKRHIVVDIAENPSIHTIKKGVENGRK